MRLRILAAVIGLLDGSSVASILLLRGALLERLDEEIEANMHRETEEFQTAADRLLPPDRARTEADLVAVYDAYFAREVPDEGETLISFIGRDIYITESATHAVPASELGDTVRFWLSLDEYTEDEIDTSGGMARFIAIPFRDGGADGLFVIANFPAAEREELTDAVAAQARNIHLDRTHPRARQNEFAGFRAESGLMESEGGTDHGNEVGERKRLGQVGTDPHALGFGSVHRVASGSDDDDRRLITALIELSQHVETVDVGQSEVEQLEIDTRLVDAVQRRLTGLHPFDVVTTPNEGLSDEGRNQRIILHDEYRCHHPPLAPAEKA